MINGMIASGVELKNSVLGKNMDATDLLLLSASPDLSQALPLAGAIAASNIGCSSISSWGESTATEATLSGHLMFTRLMDCINHPALAENHLLIVHSPAEADEQKWISFGFSGFLPALSAINENGIGAFMNVGNHTGYQAGEPMNAILLSVRSGIEKLDYNGDGFVSASDVVQAIEDKNRLGSSIIHAFKDEGASSSPVIIECNNLQGVALRTIANNNDSLGVNLVATNHHRLLYAPINCYRYQGIVNFLHSNPNISAGRSWTIMKDAAGVTNNIHAIQYISSTKQIKWATCTISDPAYLQNFSTFNLDELFSHSTSVEMKKSKLTTTDFYLSQNYPNPFNAITTIEFSIPKPARVALKIFNATGEEVVAIFKKQLSSGNYKYNWNGSSLASGIYFYRLETDSFSQTKKLILLR